MGTMIYVERLFGRLRVRLMPGQNGLGLGMVRRVRLEMDCRVMPGIFVFASLVLALTLGS